MDEKEFDTPVTGGGATPPPEGGRRSHTGKLGKGKIALIVVGAVLAVLLAAYLGLCAAAAGSGFLPGTRIMGVELSGKSREQLQQELDRTTQEHFAHMELPIDVDGTTVSFAAADARMGVDMDACLENASAGGRGFFASGAAYLSALMGNTTDVPCAWTIGDKSYVNQVVAQAADLVGQPVNPTTWEVEEDEESARLVLTRGTTGQAVDEADLKQRIEAALLSGVAEKIEATVVTTAPAAPDFEGIAAEVARDPLDASLDVETDEVIPHRLGLKLNAAKVQSLYDSLAEGESGRVELETTQPDVTTLELRATLFRDILGEGTSKITGDANRVNNVRLAAKACDGVILLPGQQMSYNQTTGQRTTAKGYREATGYTAKGQEMMVGGGVCQPSSTLYLACLTANLEIVNRKNHMYTVSYMPEGIDATVSWPNLDYVFANNTKYPIKVSMTIANNVLTARIYGTKTDSNYVKMESVRLSTTPAGVSYQADPSLPQGTTRVVQGAHTGKKVEVYKNTYSADGTLISRTWVSTDTYRPSDKIIAYNPLDGVPGVIDPVAASEEPTDPTQPSGETPATTPDTTPAPAPDPTPTPAPTPATPSVEPTPAPTPPPVDTALLPQQSPEGIPTD